MSASHFADDAFAALHQRGAVVWIESERRSLEIRGEDRFGWLNGVVTCDVAALQKSARADAPTAGYACVLNVKGKVLADAWVTTDGDSLHVHLPTSVASNIAQMWDEHIVMEDVELASDDTRSLLFVQGPDARAIATAAGLGHAATADVLGLGEGVVVEQAGATAADAIARAVAAGAVGIDEEMRAALFVRAGRARYGVDFDQSSYVQEAGVEQRAVSFTKGCYLGQEVVCMLQNRGKVHRRLVQLRLPNDAELKTGADVLADAKPVGKLTSIARGDDATFALALVKTSHAQQNQTLHVGTLSAVVVREAG